MSVRSIHKTLGWAFWHLPAHQNTFCWQVKVNQKRSCNQPAWRRCFVLQEGGFKFGESDAISAESWYSYLKEQPKIDLTPIRLYNRRSMSTTSKQIKAEETLIFCKERCSIILKKIERPIEKQEDTLVIRKFDVELLFTVIISRHWSQ